MKDPQYLITHHGYDARILTLAEMRRIYQETHYTNLYLKYDQPRGRSEEFPDIAYHVLIGSDGWEYARDFDIPGYHASNYAVNLNSLAICISGNYDKDTLSPEMEGFYREAVADLKKNFASLNKADVHRTWAAKSCPGINITDKFVQDVFKNPLPKDYEPPKEDKSHLSDLSSDKDELAECLKRVETQSKTINLMINFLRKLAG